MMTTRNSKILTCAGIAVTLLLLGAAGVAVAAEKARTEIYGHAMLDMGYQTGQSAPDWFDVMRPTKLPSFENEYGTDGQVFAGVRQTRFGVKSFFPTERGELMTIFEFELFGTGVDAGQTTFRLRHAYAQLGHFGAGQYWSPFMDINVFPNSLEYWGPNAMVFFRNVQVRWMPIMGDTYMTLALERPGASRDVSVYDERIELNDVASRLDLPDFSAEYHRATGFGYVELAGMLRSIKWDDLGQEEYDLSGDAVGWGLNLSSNVNLGSADVVRLQFVYGEGIQNYMNDAPADIGIETNPGDPNAPIKGVALPMFGALGFLDHRWNDSFSTSLGYSYLDVDNTDAMPDNAFSVGHYALVNLLWYPAKNVMTGFEVQWGKRENYNDGFTSDDLKIQFSFKANFSSQIGG